MIFNWRPIAIILFSEKTIEERISSIDQTYGQLGSYLWLPLYFCLGLTFVSPLIALLVTQYLLMVDRLKQRQRFGVRMSELKDEGAIKQMEAELESFSSHLQSKELMRKVLETKIAGLGNVLNSAKDSQVLRDALNELDLISEVADIKAVTPRKTRSAADSSN